MRMGWTGKRARTWIAASMCAVIALAAAADVGAREQRSSAVEYRVLATTKTSTMEKELNEAADAGFHFDAAMGGDTAIGGSEVVVIVARSGDARPRYAYRLLATSKTSTMQKELQEAADAGFEYRGQTVFKSVFGGEEVVCILERDRSDTPHRSEYKLVATTKTSTLQKELNEVGEQGYVVLGMTVAKTAMGGKEVVAITKRERPR
ncbi:MAG TPA: hypothetical protein VG736_06595 [Vicinamibacterales bacterium]|nr:hypothetical protein [Vicinamibacterales bacterium]